MAIDGRKKNLSHEKQNKQYILLIKVIGHNSTKVGVAQSTATSKNIISAFVTFSASYA